MNSLNGDLIKVLLIGDVGVGKTSIILRYFDIGYDETLLSTTNFDFKSKSIQINNNLVNLQVWDSLGQEKYNSISANYLRFCEGIIIVFDLSNSSSFVNVKNWINVIKEKAQSKKIIIVGNKSDLDQKRQISYDEAKEFAHELNLKYFETSAKNNTNIQEIFVDISEEIINNPDFINKSDISIVLEKRRKGDQDLIHNHSCSC